MKDCIFDLKLIAFVEKSILSNKFFQSALNEFYNYSATAKICWNSSEKYSNNCGKCWQWGIHQLFAKAMWAAFSDDRS